MCPYFMGALFLLADGYSEPQALNTVAYSLYCEFRPESERWGGKGEVKLATILNLRPRPQGISMGASGTETTGDRPSPPENENAGAAGCAPHAKKRKVEGDETAEGQRTEGEGEGGLDQGELAQFMAELDEMDTWVEI